eukprot:gene10322-7216_t
MCVYDSKKLSKGEGEMAQKAQTKRELEYRRNAVQELIYIYILNVNTALCVKYIYIEIERNKKKKRKRNNRRKPSGTKEGLTHHLSQSTVASINRLAVSLLKEELKYIEIYIDIYLIKKLIKRRGGGLEEAHRYGRGGRNEKEEHRRAVFRCVGEEWANREQPNPFVWGGWEELLFPLCLLHHSLFHSLFLSFFLSRFVVVAAVIDLSRIGIGTTQVCMSVSVFVCLFALSLSSMLLSLLLLLLRWGMHYMSSGFMYAHEPPPQPPYPI